MMTSMQGDFISTISEGHNNAVWSQVSEEGERTSRWVVCQDPNNVPPSFRVKKYVLDMDAIHQILFLFLFKV